MDGCKNAIVGGRVSATCRGRKTEPMPYNMDHHVLLRLADVVWKIEAILCGGHHFVFEHIIHRESLICGC